MEIVAKGVLVLTLWLVRLNSVWGLSNVVGGWKLSFSFKTVMWQFSSTYADDGLLSQFLFGNDVQDVSTWHFVTILKCLTSEENPNVYL